MKKTVLLFVCFIALNMVSFASTNSELFSYNESAMNQQLAELSSIETYVNQNVGTTFSVLEAEGLFATQLALLSNSAFTALAEAPPLGISPFIWGFCFGVAGIAVVYFVSENSDMTKKALLGCAVSGVLSIAIYFIAFASAFAGAASTM